MARTVEWLERHQGSMVGTSLHPNGKACSSGWAGGEGIRIKCTTVQSVL